MRDGEELSYQMVIFAGVNFDQNQIYAIVRNTEFEKASDMLKKKFSRTPNVCECGRCIVVIFTLKRVNQRVQVCFRNNNKQISNSLSKSTN